MRVQIKIWSVLDAILQMILYRVVIYSSLVEQRGRGKMCVWHFRHGMEGYLLYRNAITSLFAWFYAEDRLQSPSWSLNLAHLWEEQVGRTILWPLGISFTSEVRNVLFCPYYDQSQIVTLTALIRNIKNQYYQETPAADNSYKEWNQISFKVCEYVYFFRFSLVSDSFEQFSDADSIWQHIILSAQHLISYCNFSGE